MAMNRPSAPRAPDPWTRIAWSLGGAAGVVTLTAAGLVLTDQMSPTPTQRAAQAAATAQASYDALVTPEPTEPPPATVTVTLPPSSRPAPTGEATNRPAPVPAAAPAGPAARPVPTATPRRIARPAPQAASPATPPAAFRRPSTGGIRLPATGSGPLSGRLVVVDPGHNGVIAPAITNRLVPNGAGGRKACNTTGTATRSGYAEHAHNWSVGTRLATRLRALGADVVLTRPNNSGVGPCVDERAAIGNRAGADLVLSIHADGAASGARGFHVIRSTSMAGGARVTNASARAATTLRDTFAATTGRPRSTYLGGGTAITPRRDIAGLNLSTVPAVMLEAGNMANPVEAALLSSRAFHDKEADALARSAVAVLTR